jgi:hypothetical protein
LAQLGIRHIAAYSPEARGRSERAFRTLQDRLPKELALAGIVTIEAANRWQKRFRRASCASRKSAGSATTTPSNGVGCRCKSRRPHFVCATARVHEYPDGQLAIFHGPHRLAGYGPDGSPRDDAKLAA